ncbi:hypothetical protein JOC26_002293 [Sporohalobacter salinus]|nr:hypothetical protein [Sporohalobacter salinus]
MIRIFRLLKLENKFNIKLNTTVEEELEEMMID